MKENAIQNRYDFVMLFDCENGNPNGDPDANNMPRTDPETNIGIVTDVCLKRKIRNYIENYCDGKSGYDILIKTDKALNTKFSEAYEALGLEKKAKGKDPEAVRLARDYMCENYFDVRAFGAVMSTGDDPCGIVKGPVQINFAHSIDPVLAQDYTVTRQAVTTEADFDKKGNEMGKKSVVSYGLYRAEGYISANQAQKITGLSESDLELLWTAILNMFEEDHSAARGKLCMRQLYIFKHDKALGNAPSHKLFDKIVIEKKPGVVVPRAFTDYTIKVDEAMPDGVELIIK